MSRDRTSSSVGNWDFREIGHCWIDQVTKKVLVQTVMRDQKLRHREQDMQTPRQALKERSRTLGYECAYWAQDTACPSVGMLAVE